MCAFIDIQVKVTQCITEPEIKLTVAKNNSWRVTKNNSDSTKKLFRKGAKNNQYIVKKKLFVGCAKNSWKVAKKRHDKM